MKSRKQRKNKKHAVASKVAAVRRMEAGESVSELSQELGIARGTLYRWQGVYRAEGEAGLSRNQGPPAPGNAPPAKRDAGEQRIIELERLVGRQAAELDFFETAFGALNLAIPGRGAPGASGSTRPSSRSTPKAGSASKGSARLGE